MKDDGLAAGKGVVVTDDREAALAARGGVRARRDRGVPRRARGLAVRAVQLERGRRRDRLPAAAGAGLQADLRRRRGPQHRRHGRLHAAALGAGRARRRRAARRAAADRRRDGAARHAVRRPALRRAGADQPRDPRRRVQRPVRRPRDPAAARRCSTRRWRRCSTPPPTGTPRRRRPAARGSRGRGGRRGDGQPTATPRRPSQRRRHHRCRRGRGARRRPRHPRRHRDRRTATWSPPAAGCSPWSAVGRRRRGGPRAGVRRASTASAFAGRQHRTDIARPPSV